MSSDNRLALPVGTMLNQYCIETILGYGGFGIVYKARHQHLEQWVAIKEYLPSEIATREASTVHALGTREQDDFNEGLKRFLAEAKQLVLFDQHPNIVRCRDFFELNGTAYLVMDFEDGLPLSELLKQYEQQNKQLSEQQILDIILPLLDGLKTIHEAGVLHRDIKPGNIFIRRSDQQPVLIDFGAAKQNFSQHSKSMAPYSPGYAAIEQIEEEGNLGPWTDIYAIGAVMWRMISGQNPDQVEKRTNAIIRGKDDPMQSAVELCRDRYSTSLAEVINQCIALREEDRYQSAAAIIAVLKNGSISRSTIAKPTTVFSEPAKLNSQSIQADKLESKNGINEMRRYLPVAAVCVIAVLGTVAWLWVGQSPVTKSDAIVERLNLLAGEMVTIPGGTFRMGDLTGNGASDEMPVRAVNMKSFKLGKTEVTFAQWDACVAEGGCQHTPDDEDWGRGNRPVINASYNDITQQYIPCLSRKSGQQFRLPSEAEWEYTARAGRETDYPWGNSIGSNNANCDSCGSQWDRNKTAPVGSFSPNRFGLLDMQGNVWEWTEDCWNENYSGAPSDGREWAGGDCDSRVLRGGSWNVNSDWLRSSYRIPSFRVNRDFNGGFRLAQDL